jgi:filamentous hemagglutinin family protein
VPSFVSSGAGAATQTGNTLTVTQTTDAAVFNWQSFNIGPDGRVDFTQPSASAVALNRIFDSAPSRIFGVLTATGRVYLLNRNGIVFGNGAQVNVGGLVAASLDLTPEALQLGIARAAQAGAPAFTAYRDAAGASLESGAVQVQQGARITSPGGQVLLFAPTVSNEGVISTPDGQTVLAAGQQIYLVSSTDPDLRGLLVEVSGGGTVSNGRESNGSVARPEDLVGQIDAARGNVTLVGLAVNQSGRISATTSVRANGSIRLLARDGATVTGGASNPTLLASNGGTLRLTPRSDTAVTLDDDPRDRSVDVNPQPASRVLLEGRRIDIGREAQVTARAGQIDIIARADPRVAPAAFPASGDDARISIARGARLDVAGARAELPMQSNLLTVELRGSQLANSPIQRDGPLRCTADRCTPVTVDIRQTGTRADGTTWIGTPLADLTGDVSTITRSVAERSLNGGTITLQSSGDVIVADGATLDLSGGVLRFLDGNLITSQLLGEDGRLYDMANADPERRYVGVADVVTVDFVKWGISNTYTGFGAAARGTFEAGYVEGRDAGTLNILAPRVIFDGRVIGNTTVGRYQRLPAAQLPAGATRPRNQLPRGASLVFGNATPVSGGGAAPNYLLGPVVIGDGLVLPGLLNDAGQPFDVSVDAWPSRLTTSRIRPQLLGDGAGAQLAVFANGRIRLTAEGGVSVPAGGSLALTGSGVDVLANVVAPGGSIAFTARPTVTDETATGIVLGPGVQLLARGGWINDDPRFGRPLAPLHISGGRVSLTAEQSALRTSSGTVIDVSAGAWRRSGGDVIGGRGGSITLGVTPTVSGEPVAFVLETELRGFALTNGGTLSFTANQICVAPQRCGNEASTLWLSPERLNAGGFSSLRLSANFGELAVRPDTVLGLRQQNYEFARSPINAPTGVDFDTLVRVTQLDPLLRRPVNLSMSVRQPATAGPFGTANFTSAPSLRIGVGALIDLDPLATVSLRSNTTVQFEGTLLAPAGAVTFGLDSDLTLSDFASQQAIWLGSGARVDVSGRALVFTDETGRRRGDVLDGGTVTLDAARGSVITLPGSMIDVSGTSATLDVPVSADGRGGFVAQPTGSRGGSVRLSAAESILLGGSLRARGGTTDVAGGSLSVLLDTTRRNDPGVLGNLLPTAPRRIVFSDTLAPLIVPPGTGVPAAYAGQALLAADSIESAGFDFLDVAARGLDLLSAGQIIVGAVPGQIDFRGDLDLSLRGRISLDAARYRTDGGHARIAASAVTLGHADAERQGGGADDVPVAGQGTLSVSAGFIELVGTARLFGFATTEFASLGDIRLRGVQSQYDPVPLGLLETAGDLVFRARQLYPSTLTDFTLMSRDAVDGRIRFTAAPGERDLVLSAAGRLTVSAPYIEQAGALRAPFGEIALRASQLTLQPSSVTSTSAEGALIPFGTTQGGFDWTYQLPRRTIVYGAGAERVPVQRVLLQADRVDFLPGAVVDVSGGGDLFAYEFVPGTTGTRDILDPLLRPDQFAVLPSLGLAYAPFDPSAAVGSSLRPGDSVYLAGGGGLAAGFYTLLPARYALLPGAYLVTAVDGYDDLPEDTVLPRLDGSTIVAGYRTLTGTSIRDPRRRGFAVRPGATASAEARYDVRRASEFFATQYAAAGLAPPRLANDAGTLSIQAGRALALEGRLRAVPREGGRGAALDLSGERLEVVRERASAPSGGIIQVAAEDLASLGAESVLLGGTRTADALGARIDVAARSVRIGADARISAPELLLVATDTVAIEQNARIAADASASRAPGTTLLLRGDSAIVRVANGAAADIRRSAVTGSTGDLRVASGAVLEAGDGSLLLDATRDARSAGVLSTSGSLSLGAGRITLGQVDSVDEGLLLSSDTFAASQLRELRLRSNTTIDLFGVSELQVRRLLIDAAGVRAGDGVRSGSAETTLRAQTIELRNSSASAVTGSDTGTGRLSLLAEELLLGGGDFSFLGLDRTLLRGSRELFSLADTRLQFAGAAAIETARVAAADGVRTVLGATGALSLGVAESEPSEAVPTAREPGLGARFDLAAARVAVDTVVAAPAGVLAVRSTGVETAVVPGSTGRSIVLGERAELRLAGQTLDFDDVRVTAPGGTVRLLAQNGGIEIARGATIDVSAAADGDAGRIELRAANGVIDMLGSLRGTAHGGGRGGSFVLDAVDFGGFSALNARLNDGGFGGERDIRLRGAGDLVVGAGERLVARRVALTADGGNIGVLGSIDARGPDGGVVVLSAGREISVAGRIDAAATAVDGNGGRVALRAAAGGALRVADTAQIDVSAGAGAPGVEAPRSGRLDLRVDRAAALSVLDADTGNDRLRLSASAVRGAGTVDLEAFEIYTDADGLIGAAETAPSSPWNAQATTFMANARKVVAALGWAADSALTVLPGIEVRAAAGTGNSFGNLRLSSGWNLASWRYPEQPGILTLRAPGSLLLDASLSDGFTDLTGSAAFTLTATGRSWSYRLVGGADLGSADPLAVRPLHELPDGVGNVQIAAGTPGIGAANSVLRMVRTGTGDIEVAAGRDFTLGNRASVLYTAGRDGGGVLLSGSGNLGGRVYPVDGGDIRIFAQGNVRGAQTNRLITDWLWRTGRSPGNLNTIATGWTVNFQRFEQNVGALGGGSVFVRAGGDIDTLSVVAPSIGRQVGGNAAENNRVELLGQGDIDIAAGGDIRGGIFQIGGGEGRIRAGGALTADSGESGRRGLYPILALGTGRFEVTSLGPATIESVVNFSLLPQGISQLGTVNLRNQSYFSSYGVDSMASIKSVGGSVSLLLDDQTDGALVRRFRDTMFLTQVNNATTSLRIGPPRLELASLAGDVEIAAPLTLYPSVRGNLALFARDDLRLGTRGLGSIIVSDADPESLPSVAAPSGSFALLFDVLDTALTNDRRFNATTPLASPSRRPAGEPTSEPIRLVAQRGSILHRVDDVADTSLLYFSRAARIIAGRDIRDLSLTVQHVVPTDLTLVAAGRDITYSTGREPNGAISPNLRSIAVDGPGRLQLEAGRNVDLQASAGITTRGNLRNLALADEGASVSVLAGVGDGARDFAAFIRRYLEQSLELLARLRGFVTGTSTGRGEDSAGAFALFTALSTEERAGFLDRLFPDGSPDEPGSGRVAVGADVRQRTDYLATLVDYEALLIRYVTSLVTDRVIDSPPATNAAEALALFMDVSKVSRARQSALLQEILFAELRSAGRIAAQPGAANGDVSPAFTALETFLPGSNPNVDAGETNRFAGDIRLFFSRIYTLDGGDIDLLAPGGGINVGLATPPAAFGVTKPPDQLGIVAQSSGSVRAAAFGSFEVNESRVFAADGGDILIWSTRGDIDAGRGAKTAISAPPPLITFDDNGFPVVSFPAALTGSGIQTLATTPGRQPGDVDLFAPRGVVNASDAGIVCRNCTIFATAVIGANNIQIGGVSVGVPVDTGGLAAGLSGVSNVASTASSAAAAAVSQDAGARGDAQSAPLAESAIGWLEVFIEGFGEEVCKPTDEECLKRNRRP